MCPRGLTGVQSAHYSHGMWVGCPIVEAADQCDPAAMLIARIISVHLLVLILGTNCSAGAEGEDNSMLLLLLAAAARAVAAQDGPAYFTSGQAAGLVVGQSGFTAGTANRGVFPPTANTFSSPYGLVLAGSRLFVSDQGNHRALGFNTVPTATDAAADLVVGQSTFGGAGVGSTASTFNNARGLGASSDRLLVSDQSNHRVQVFNPVPTASDPSASIAIGATSTAAQGNQACTASDLNAPIAVTIVGSKVIVADSGDGRVLIWNSIPSASYSAADVVLGKATKTGCGGGAPAANTLSSPFGVWSDGTRLLVADRSNSRVLLWNTFPTSDGQAADVALGQSSLTGSTGLSGQASLSLPNGVYSNGTQIFVADGGNNRVMIWNTFPTTSGASADVVLGQQNFSGSTANSGGIGAATLSSPTGILLHGKRLLVADYSNHRVLIYEGRATP